MVLKQTLVQNKINIKMRIYKRHYCRIIKLPQTNCGKVFTIKLTKERIKRNKFWYIAISRVCRFCAIIKTANFSNCIWVRGEALTLCGPDGKKMFDEIFMSPFQIYRIYITRSFSYSKRIKWNTSAFFYSNLDRNLKF